MNAFTIAPYQALFFDLDGTLVDSAPDIAASVDATLAVFGWQPAGLTTVRDWVGNGAKKLVERALRFSLQLPVDGDEAIDSDLLDRVQQEFLTQYALHNGPLSQVYPGVREFLDHCRAQHKRMSLITNKPHALAVQLLAALELDHYFEIVIGGDSYPVRKPDPIALNHCREQFGLPANQCLMVGDSETDLNAARNAGIDCLCVSYGYNRGRDIRQSLPTCTVDDLRELI